MSDWTDLVISEHVNKPKFMTALGIVAGAIQDITTLINGMPTLFDVDSAAGDQLDKVGEWVGRSRVVDQVLDPEFFGFADDNAALPFGELTNVAIGGRFYEQGEGFATSSTLGDPEYRTILKAKIVRNQWDGSIEGLENALAFVFNSQAAVIDNGDLTLQINIGRPITGVEKALLSTFDILPRAGGVKITSIQYVNFISAAAHATVTATGHL